MNRSHLFALLVRHATSMLTGTRNTLLALVICLIRLVLALALGDLVQPTNCALATALSIGG